MKKLKMILTSHFMEDCSSIEMVDQVFEAYNGVFLTVQEDLKRLSRDKSTENQIELLGNENHQPYRQKADDKSNIVFLFLHSN